MKTRRNVAALGALVMVAAVAFVWGLYFLLGTPLLRGGMDVAVALESGSGLKRGDLVRVAGVGIGSVKEVDLVPTGGVVIELRLNERLNIPNDSRVVVTGDVFGAHIVDLIPGGSDAMMQEGDTLVGMAAPELTDLATELGGRVGDLLGRADTLLAPGTVADMRATAAALPETAREMRAAFEELRIAAASLRRSAELAEAGGTGASVAAAARGADSAAAAVSLAAERLDLSLRTFDRALGNLDSVLEKIDRGDGTLGLLVNDPVLYQDFSSAVRELEALAVDLRTNPRKYFNFSVF
ncbi:MAG: MlaD family protein [Gemmatimonadota bacterium]